MSDWPTPLPPPFVEWLRKQSYAKRTDLIGDLARELRHDRCVTSCKTAKAYWRHLMKNHDPDERHLRALDLAEAEWKELLQRAIDEGKADAERLSR